MNTLLLVELLGSVGIFLGGSFFHFLYKYGGKRKWMAIVSPVNESIWEHLKIAFYPALVFTAIEYLIVRSVVSNYLTAEIVGIYLMILIILVAEWIYPAILKRNILVLDLVVFFVAILASQVISYAIMTDPNLFISINKYLIVGIIAVQTLIFAVLTFRPIHLPLWRDSVDGKYGIK